MFCILFIKCLMTNVKKNVINEHSNVSEILLQHCLLILNLIGARGQNEPVFRFSPIKLSFYL